MRQVGRSVQCRQNRRGRTAATWPFPMSDAEKSPFCRGNHRLSQDCLALEILGQGPRDGLRFTETTRTSCFP